MKDPTNLAETSLDTMTENQLLDDIKNSIVDMQKEMQNTYNNLQDTKIIGESNDKTVRVIMTATYTFEDIELDPKALQGGLKEFKRRIWQAMKDLTEKIQQATQNKTLELIQNMQIPDDIRNISMGGDSDDSDGKAGGSTD